MAEPEAANAWHVFVRSRRNSNDEDGRSGFTIPQIPEESGDLQAENSTHNLPADHHIRCTDAPTSVKSHSPTTPSSVDGVFLTAPQTPAESIDLNLKSDGLFPSSPGLYKSANEPKDKWEPITMSPNTSKESKTMISENISVLFSPTSRSPEATTEEVTAEPGHVVQIPGAHIPGPNPGDTRRLRQANVAHFGPRPMSLQEQSITGAGLGIHSNNIPDETPVVSPTRPRNRIIQTPGSGRRHAIPIIRPPTPSSEEPPLQNYEHGLDGVPAHYIPLYGTLHGLFYDPITNTFIGDGPPRSTPERPDGSVPCLPDSIDAISVTPAAATVTATRATRATAAPQTTPLGMSPEDVLHIQTRSFIYDLNVVRQPFEDPHPSSNFAVSDNLYPAGRVPSKRLFFCRCAGKWLLDRHKCDRGLLEDMPDQSGLAVRSAAQLPEGWVTHRVVVDPRMYPGGVTPVQTTAGPMVGGQPAKFFTPVAETRTHPSITTADVTATHEAPQNPGNRHQIVDIEHEPAISEVDDTPVPVPTSPAPVPASRPRSEIYIVRSSPESDSAFSLIIISPTPEAPAQSRSPRIGPSSGTLTRTRGAGPAVMIGGQRRRGKAIHKGGRGSSHA